MIRIILMLALALFSIGCGVEGSDAVEERYSKDGVSVHLINWKNGDQSIFIYATDEFAKSHGWEDTRVQVTAIKKAGSSDFKLYRVSYEWNGGHHRSDMLWYRPSSAPEVEGWKKRFDVMYNVIKDGLRKEAV